MRHVLAAVAAAALLTAPLAAQKIGARTTSSETLLAEVGIGSSDAELARQAAAASAYPLGTLENPVRVGGPAGQQAYIARLRCADGRAPAAGAARPAGIGAFGSVVEAFTLNCAGAPGRFELVMDMFHAEHEEQAAPAGFTLAR